MADLYVYSCGCVEDHSPGCPKAEPPRDTIESLTARLEAAEAQRDAAQKAFQALIDRRESDRVRMRAGGIAFEAVREVLRDHEDAELTFGRVVELLRVAVEVQTEAAEATITAQAERIRVLEEGLRLEHDWRLQDARANTFDGGTGDHACVECRPYSDMIKPGFRCAYHNTRALLTTKKEQT